MLRTTVKSYLPHSKASSKPIAIWLLIGVAMIMIQVLLGGITRLTESGLSITEWKPITGILPPMDNASWQAEFDKYKNTDQFRYIHADFSLSDFKFIFFWEWLHRSWARLLGVVFLAGFVYFLVRKKFKKEMVIPMIILFLLGALQGLVGWIMVKSGLAAEKMFVGHIELAIHFIAALNIIVLYFLVCVKVIDTGTKKGNQCFPEKIYCPYHLYSFYSARLWSIYVGVKSSYSGTNLAGYKWQADPGPA